MDILTELLQQKVTMNAGLYAGAAIVGQIFYAVRLWTRKEINCVFDRFRSDRRWTIAAVFSNLGILSGIILGLGDSLATLPPQAMIAFGFMQGISADSIFNKSSRSVWNPEDRVPPAP